jgi:hypothetical protein
MADHQNFDEVFRRLKTLLSPYAHRLVVVSDQPGNYYLDTSFLDKNKKRLFFGAAQVRKNYVSFYLMPVYMFPELLDGVSPDLKKRMQGKSCFNFRSVDETAFAELASLVKKCLEKLEREKIIRN